MHQQAQHPQCHMQAPSKKTSQGQPLLQTQIQLTNNQTHNNSMCNTVSHAHTIQRNSPSLDNKPSLSKSHMYASSGRRNGSSGHSHSHNHSVNNSHCHGSNSQSQKFFGSKNRTLLNNTYHGVSVNGFCSGNLVGSGCFGVSGITAANTSGIVPMLASLKNNTLSNPTLNNSLSNLISSNQGMQTLLHQNLITKNQKLSTMIRQIHGYMTHVQQLAWILKQCQKIIKTYIKQTVQKQQSPQNNSQSNKQNLLKKPELSQLAGPASLNPYNKQKSTPTFSSLSHKMLIENIYNELVKLINRFNGVDRKWLQDMTVPLRETKRLFNRAGNGNFKKSQTIGSFQCTEAENQEDFTQYLFANNNGQSINSSNLNMHTDFSKIKLPSVIKQSQLEQSQHTYPSTLSHPGSNPQTTSLKTLAHPQSPSPTVVSNLQTKLSHYQSALQLLKKQLEEQKQINNQLKLRYDKQVDRLNNRVSVCNNQWELYKNFAKNCIKKCKYYLRELGGDDGTNAGYTYSFSRNKGYQDSAKQNEDNTNIDNKNTFRTRPKPGAHPTTQSLPPLSFKLEQILDELFALQTKLDRKILQNSTLNELELQKQQKLVELINVEAELKGKREELAKLGALASVAGGATKSNGGNSLVSTGNPSINIVGNLGNALKNVREESEMYKLLYIQATTIQHLI